MKVSQAAVAILSATLIGVGVTGCAPVTALSGYQAVGVTPADIKVGEDTRTSVATKLGSPTVVSAFDPSLWYYMSQTSEKMAYLNPQIKSRTIVSIHFDKDEKVTEVKQFQLKDGYELAYSNRETPTRGREMTILEQILGNVGRGGVLPQDDDPGRRPGDRSGRPH